MKRKRRSTVNRTGTTVSEAMVAAAILAIAATAVGRFVSSVQTGLRDRELSARIDWEITNAREQVGSWPISKIRSEAIEALPLSAFLRSSLEEPRWQAEVKSIRSPIDARQVTLRLKCVFPGQPATPAQLTFWAIDEEPQETSSNPPTEPVDQEVPGGSDDS